MKRMTMALLLILAMLLSISPAALCETTCTAHTPLSGASAGQRENIDIAAEALDGLIVRSDERFSFNETVGPRTKARGYVSAENGRGVEVTGGGVGQVATTLYLALLEIPDDIRIEDISTYDARFKGDYVSDGHLAVITDYSSGTDFAFRNEGNALRIEMWSDEDALYCAITRASAGSSSGWPSDTGSGSSAPVSPKPTGACFRCDGDDDTLHNIELAAGSVYDTTLSEGDLFSFNEIVGPRTSKYGYVDGINGRGVDVTGGGVAQVASVIWLAVKDMDDISIVEKSTYGEKYNQSYVSNSSDAIVTDYSADTDFSFRYTGSGSITLYTYVQDGWLCCDVVRN